ncbi:zinc finger, CCHC-type containing protein [Tanacetum coccineum]
MNQPHGFIMPDNENKVCKLIKSLYGLKQALKQWHQKVDEVVLSNGYLLNQVDKCVDLTKELLSSRLSIKDIGEAYVIMVSTPIDTKSHYIENVLNKFNYFDCTSVSTPMDTSENLMPNNGQTVSQLEYSRVIGCLMYVMTCRRLDIVFVVGKLSRLMYTGYPSVLEGYTNASWISNTKENSSTNGWVFLLGGGAISWASKKQTCIIGSIMESKFVSLASAGKEAEWLKNLLLEISLWSKLIAPISIRYDSDATLAKAYSQIYNGKSRHLGVRHSMIHELITNRVVSIEFVRSQQNLADYLTNGLARDLVIKSAEGIGSMDSGSYNIYELDMDIWLPKEKETLMKNLVDNDEKIPNNQQEEEQLYEELNAKADPEEVLGRTLWKEHSQDVIKNMHKLPKASYEGLSMIMDIDVHVLRQCVKHYFKHELYISPEVLAMRKDHLGNQPETLTEEDEDGYYNDLELSLYEAMQVVSWTKDKSFTQICSEHNMPEEELKYHVNLVISFGIAILDEQELGEETKGESN